MAQTSRHLRRAGTIAATIVTTASLLALVGTPADAASRPAGPLAPSTGALFGAYVQAISGETTQQTQSRILGEESALGRKLAIDNHYFGWSQRLDASIVYWDIAQGRIPMLSWWMDRTTRVASGLDDAWIKTQALHVKALGVPVFLRTGWEMNGDWAAWWSVSPSSYIDAWKRIRRIFAQQGATNAVWVWCASTNFAAGPYPPSAYYPGSRWVDWIGGDGYNWAPAIPGAPYRSFSTFWGPYYDWAVAFGKPLMVGETGVQEGATSTDSKAAWVAQAESDIVSKYPALEAFVYWDSIGQDHFGTQPDFRFATSSASLAAFQQFGSDPYFSPPHGV